VPGLASSCSLRRRCIIFHCCILQPCVALVLSVARSYADRSPSHSLPSSTLHPPAPLPFRCHLQVFLGCSASPHSQALLGFSSAVLCQTVDSPKARTCHGSPASSHCSVAVVSPVPRSQTHPQPAPAASPSSQPCTQPCDPATKSHQQVHTAAPPISRLAP
jgi:hypothetical protein